MSRRNLTLSLIITLLVAGGGFFAFRQFASAQTSTGAANLATATVERGTLTASVSAAGALAAPQSATLTWGLAGTVGAIDVTVGQVVTPGTVLMELNPASLPASALQAQADLLTAQKNLDTLKAGPTPAQIAQAQNAVITAQLAITTAQTSLANVLHPNLAYYQDQVNRAQQALVAAQQNATVIGYQNTLTNALTTMTNNLSALQLLQKIEAENPGWSALHGNRLENAQIAYDRSVQDYQAAKYQAEQSQASAGNAVADAQTALTTAQANLAAAQKPDAAKVTEAQAAVDLAKANLIQAQTDLATLLATPTAQDVAAAQAKVDAAQVNANLPRLTAPFTGTVVAIYSQPGDLVSSGTTAVAIADLSTLLVNIDVSEVDINRVAIGQEATLTLDAASGKTFAGQVSDVGAVGKTASGVVTFPVKVVIPKPDKTLRPGMTAAVSIVTDKRNDVLLVPNRAIKASGSQRTVTKLFEGKQTVVPVTLGLTGDTQTEITGGALQEGDTILSGATTTTNRTTNRTNNGGGFGGPPGD